MKKTNKPVTIQEVQYALSRVKLTTLVEKGVPIPHKASEVSSIRELMQMLKPRESMVLPFDITKKKKKLRLLQISVQSTAKTIRKNSGKEINYVTRTVPNGLRVWRAA